MSRLFVLVIACATLIAVVDTVEAATPNTLNYQGRLLDNTGAPVADGAYLIRFRIYDAATGGTTLWDTGFRTLMVTDGLFSYHLGDSTALPANLFADHTDLWLGIKVGTDPELSPRVRLTSAAFARQAQMSDTAMLARDADSLGGLQPAYYRNWNNLTNIPAGFADGVDNIGIDSTIADGLFLRKSEDTTRGKLYFDPNGDGIVDGELSGNGNYTNLFLMTDAQAKAELYGQGYGTLYLYDNAGHNAATVDATPNSGGSIRLQNSSGIQTINLNGDGTGDASVNLPTDAISNTEILDEPGIAQGRNTSGITLNSGSMTDIVTVTITIPTAGYIFLSGEADLYLGGTTNENLGVLQIDETSGGGFGFYTTAGFFAPPNTSQVNFRSGALRTYFKSAGTYTFRLEGMQVTGGGGTVYADHATLTAIFIPTSYGSVTTVSSNPGDIPDAQKVETTNPDGSTGTAFLGDLRQLELKAKEAEISRQKAELAEQQAKMELERARRTVRSDIR